MFDHIVPAPSDSDIARGYEQERDEHVAELEHYVNPETLHPVLVVDTQARVKAYATANNVSLGMGLTKWQEGLKRLCTDEATRFDRGRISLDVDGQFSGRLWSCPPVDGESIPQVVFAALRTTSPLFEAGKVEAVAVYYLPPRRTVVKYNRTTGLPYEVSDDYDARGYLGIVRMFDSVGRAEDALVDLERAVRFCGKPVPSAYEDDEVAGTVSAPAPVSADII
jgi:hypothetical protein